MLRKPRRTGLYWLDGWAWWATLLGFLILIATLLLVPDFIGGYGGPSHLILRRGAAVSHAP
jgi:hypothetical protein